MIEQYFLLAYSGRTQILSLPFHKVAFWYQTCCGPFCNEMGKGFLAMTSNLYSQMFLSEISQPFSCKFIMLDSGLPVDRQRITKQASSYLSSTIKQFL